MTPEQQKLVGLVLRRAWDMVAQEVAEGAPTLSRKDAIDVAADYAYFPEHRRGITDPVVIEYLKNGMFNERPSRLYEHCRASGHWTEERYGV